MTPVVDAPREITDTGHTLYAGASFNPENTAIARVGNLQAHIYRVDQTHVYVRVLNLESNTWLPAVLVDNLSTDYSGLAYHCEPSLLPDGLGRFHALVWHVSQIFSCVGGFGTAPRHRLLPNLQDSGTWGAAGCLPSRIENIEANWFNAPFLMDISGVYDPVRRVTTFIGEGNNYDPMDGRAFGNSGGAPAVMYQIDAAGDVQGPYLFTECKSNEPVQAEVTPGSDGGVIFTKAELAIVELESGATRLGCCWQVRNTFENPSPTLREWNYKLSVAISDDGGVTWKNVTGTVTKSLTATLGGEHPHIHYKDDRFLAYGGDTQQNTSRAFDLDPQGNPAVVIMPPRPGQTSKYIFGRMDWAQNPITDLMLCRWTGSQWVVTTIDATQNWINARPRLRIAPDNTYLVFVTKPVTGDQVWMYRSTDQGATWTVGVIFAGASTNFRIGYQCDLQDPHVVNLVTMNSATRRQYLTRVRTSEDPTTEPPPNYNISHAVAYQRR